MGGDNPLPDVQYFCVPLQEVDYARYNVASLLYNNEEMQATQLAWIFQPWAILKTEILSHLENLETFWKQNLDKFDRNLIGPQMAYYRLFIRPLLVLDTEWQPQHLDGYKDFTPIQKIQQLNQYPHPPKKAWHRYCVYWTLFTKLNLMQMCRTHQPPTSAVYKKLEAMAKANLPLANVFVEFYRTKRYMPTDDELDAYIRLYCKDNVLLDYSIRYPEADIKYVMRVEEDNILGTDRNKVPYITINRYMRPLPINLLLAEMQQYDLHTEESPIFLCGDFEEARKAVCARFTAEEVMERYKKFEHFRLDHLTDAVVFDPARMTIVTTALLRINFLEEMLIQLLVGFSDKVDVSSKTLHVNKATQMAQRLDEQKETHLTQLINAWADSVDFVDDYNYISPKAKRFLMIYRQNKASAALDQLRENPSAQQFYETANTQGVMMALALFETHEADDLITTHNIFEMPVFETSAGIKKDSIRKKNIQSYLAFVIEQLLALHPERGCPIPDNSPRNIPGKTQSRIRYILPFQVKDRIFYYAKQVIATHFDLVRYCWKNEKWTDEDLLKDGPVLNDIQVCLYDSLYPHPTRVLCEDTLPALSMRLYDVPFFQKTCTTDDVWIKAVQTCITPVVYEKTKREQEHEVNKNNVGFYAWFREVITVCFTGMNRCESVVNFPMALRHYDEWQSKTIQDVALFYQTYRTLSRHVVLQHVLILLRNVPPLFDAIRKYYVHFYMWVAMIRIIMNDVVNLLSSQVRMRPEYQTTFESIFDIVLMPPKRSANKNGTTKPRKNARKQEPQEEEEEQDEEEEEYDEEDGGFSCKKFLKTSVIRRQIHKNALPVMPVIQNQNGLRNIFAIAEQYLRNHCTYKEFKFGHRKRKLEALKQVCAIFLERNRQPKKDIVPADENISFPLSNVYECVEQKTLEAMIMHIRKQLPTDDIDFYDLQLFGVSHAVCSKFFYVIESFCSANSSNKIGQFMFTSLTKKDRYTIYAFCDIAQQHMSMWPVLIPDYRFQAEQIAAIARANDVRPDELTDNVANIVIVPRKKMLHSPMFSGASGPKGITYNLLSDSYSDRTPDNKMLTKHRQRVPTPTIMIPPVGFIIITQDYSFPKKYKMPGNNKKKKGVASTPHSIEGGSGSMRYTAKRFMQKRMYEEFFKNNPIPEPEQDPPECGICPPPTPPTITDKNIFKTNYDIHKGLLSKRRNEYRESVGEFGKISSSPSTMRTHVNIPSNMSKMYGNRRPFTKVKSMISSPCCANVVPYTKHLNGPWENIWCNWCLNRENMRHLLQSCYHRGCPIVPGKSQSITFTLIDLDLMQYVKVLYCDKCWMKQYHIQSMDYCLTTEGLRERNNNKNLKIVRRPAVPTLAKPPRSRLRFRKMEGVSNNRGTTKLRHNNNFD
jgi:hypothetical protein